MNSLCSNRKRFNFHSDHKATISSAIQFPIETANAKYTKKNNTQIKTTDSSQIYPKLHHRRHNTMMENDALFSGCGHINFRLEKLK